MMAPRTRAVLALGTAQTVAWAARDRRPAILAAPMARDLGLTTGWAGATCWCCPTLVFAARLVAAGGPA